MSKIIMSNIIELEVRNLSTEEKEQLLKKFSDENKVDDRNKQYYFKGYYYKKRLSYCYIDDFFEVYFKDNLNEFIAFQKSNKNSLYNQALKKCDFKDLSYKDVVEDLEQWEKKEIIRKEVSIGGVLQLRHGIDKEYDSLWSIEPKLKEEIKSYKKALELGEKNNHEIKKIFPNLDENLDEYLKNEYVLTRTNTENWKLKELKFFKNNDEIILFALNEPKIAPYILDQYEELLNPHRQVNRWIVKNYKLELAQKDNTE
ncbi:hypothetical protein [Mesomycoplasma ovipneumoniae]|uniref:hypothetical protein n=1 Tax=Mesomycoplasma ovipneumoniae TaxID=29562 RepID=UPI0029640BE8|nr:hypothetical protein [Mesomycoplasma ovipneumoniae]MDW2923530.1 hypothetical protein [Mesomycoplasma ovipneumoniae]